MSTSKWLLGVVWVAAFLGLVACNYTDGVCWPKGEDPPWVQDPGAGGGPVIVDGTGGTIGEAPKEPLGEDGEGELPCNKEDLIPACNETVADGVTLDDSTYAACSGECKCSPNGVHGFSPSVFKFVTIVADDGEGEGGGWQEAVGTLKFLRWTSLLPDSWSCTVTVGMPIRTAVYGKISPQTAATISADIASIAAKNLMDVKPELPPGIFCAKLAPLMKTLVKSAYPSLGASVK